MTKIGVLGQKIIHYFHKIYPSKEILLGAKAVKETTKGTTKEGNKIYYYPYVTATIHLYTERLVLIG